MRVFLSWSGTLSHDVAVELRSWLPMVVPSAHPWMADRDIDAGDRWSSALAEALRTSEFAILILTEHSVHAPWLLFEAGSLSRLFDANRVIPYIIDVDPHDLPGPLAQFQARGCDRNATLELVARIDAGADSSIGSIEVAARFDAHWRSFEERLKTAIVNVSPSSFVPRRVQKAEVIRFDTTTNFELYLAHEVRKAKREIRNLSWTGSIRGPHDVKSPRESLQEYDRSIADVEVLIYKEIFIFTDRRRVAQLEQRLQHSNDGHSWRYFEQSDAHIPRVQFMLIDDATIVFAPASSAAAGLIVRDSHLGLMFREYFDEVWAEARQIKEGTDTDHSTIDRILSFFLPREDA